MNPSSPNIHRQILQSCLHILPKRVSLENLNKDHSMFSEAIILIPTTFFLDNYVLILLGKIIY